MTAFVRSPLARARDTFGRARVITDSVSVAAGRALTRLGTSLLLVPHRGERVEVPSPITTDAAPIDIVDDLVAYTGLEREQVLDLIQRRHESFRVEWHAFPPALRNEGWFYLSSRTYLFANATHDGETIADSLDKLLPARCDILEFGGGTGNLALALAARGHAVDFVERSALQKDFVRFRVDRSGFDRVRILDQWAPLERARYDLVCAFDVFEHVETLAETLDNVLSSIRPSGLLAESSPFVRNVSNPMHHETEAEFVGIMKTHGFVRTRDDEHFRLWTRPISQ